MHISILKHINISFVIIKFVIKKEIKFVVVIFLILKNI